MVERKWCEVCVVILVLDPFSAGGKLVANIGMNTEYDEYSHKELLCRAESQSP
jgi:hypothetical protein